MTTFPSYMAFKTWTIQQFQYYRFVSLDLAVFVGPFISLVIAKRQMVSSTRTSEKQIISPIRQAWI